MALRVAQDRGEQAPASPVPRPGRWAQRASPSPCSMTVPVAGKFSEHLDCSRRCTLSSLFPFYPLGTRKPFYYQFLCSFTLSLHRGVSSLSSALILNKLWLFNFAS